MPILTDWIPHLNSKVWILAAGRFLSQVGSGFTLFYAPIFFVNRVGLSATLVGIGLGSASVSGILGRFLGGHWADSPQWGRRKTLLLSAAISALADVVLALTYDFPSLVAGNLLMGLGVGLYWPATEAAVADLTTEAQRNEAFAITRLADNLGLSLGVVLGGALIAAQYSYRSLFVIDGISFVVFFAIVYRQIAETGFKTTHSSQSGWLQALGDRRLMVYVVVNILFTTYLAQIQTSLPLYLKNFVHLGGGEKISEATISGLFSWHIIFAALIQLPLIRWLNRFASTRALMFSLVLWGGGFMAVWLSGGSVELLVLGIEFNLILAAIAVTVFAAAMDAYTPPASALVVSLAPQSLRGVYFSISSQCWAIGYLIGPMLGGWALDQSAATARNFWLCAAVTIVLGILILRYLERIWKSSKPYTSPEFESHQIKHRD